MKIPLLLPLLSVIFLEAQAQQTEFSFGGYTTLMHFSGASAAGTSFMYDGVVNRTNNAYGNKSDIGFGIFTQAQFFVKNNFFIGVQGSFDALRSRVDINGIDNTANPFGLKATGKTNISSLFINANPFIGYRFQMSAIQLDASAGFETGFVLRSYEEGRAVGANQAVYKTNNKLDNVKTDNRIKAGVTVYYNRFSINASYARGLTDYTKGMIGTEEHGAYANVIRLGVGVKIF